MNELNVIDVYAVYGDSMNVGRGMLIGVYEEEKHANMAKEGRGCLDSASLPYVRLAGERGQGTIEKRKAIKVNDEVYLLELNHLIKLNTELFADKRVSSCTGETPISYFKVKVIDVSEPIEFMKFLRLKTGMSLYESKMVLDKARKTHNAIVEPFHDNIENILTKEEFLSWKQELELRQIAKIEAI